MHKKEKKINAWLHPREKKNSIAAPREKVALLRVRRMLVGSPRKKLLSYKHTKKDERKKLAVYLHQTEKSSLLSHRRTDIIAELH